MVSLQGLVAWQSDGALVVLGEVHVLTTMYYRCFVDSDPEQEVRKVAVEGPCLVRTLHHLWLHHRLELGHVVPGYRT